MKTTLITIALTSLITLNAHAATFVMQAHTPKGVQVMEGNKGSETPVVPEINTPSNPSNWIVSDFQNYHAGYTGAGHYENMTCYGSHTNGIAAIDNNGELMLFITKNGVNVSTPNLKFNNDNGKRFIYDDNNQNNTLDNGEATYYVGNYWAAPRFELCGTDLVDTPIEPAEPAWIDAELSGYGHYEDMVCNYDENDNFIKVIGDGNDFTFPENYDTYRFLGTTYDPEFFIPMAQNGKKFFFHDANQNEEYDEGEDKFFVGNKWSEGIENINGQDHNVQRFFICN